MTRFVSTIVLGLSLCVGCSKDEAKQEAPAPGQQGAQTAPGQVNVQTAGTTVKVGQGAVEVKTPGATVQAAGQPGQPAVMQQDDRKLTIDNNKVEAKTGDGRKAVVTGDTVKLQGPDGKTVEVKGGTVNAGGVKIEGNKVVVPGVGTVQQ